ncbi:PAX3- and PAX7-binding protein isoform X1 [Spatholobus suberectus]|nr:PAX3- and PAX7-binding protein isoform X1 [Spatholobus suberectus]
MSTAKSHNFRGCCDDTEANDEDGDTLATTTTLPSKPLSFAKLNKPQSPKLLSFADDKENENPRPHIVKPQRFAIASKPSFSSSSSHKITTLKDRITHSSFSPLILSNVQPQVETYTKEALCEL